MIRGRCRTNLDDYQRYHWPDRFAAVPRVGDRVEDEDRRASLRVCSITHSVEHEYEHPENSWPIIIVELNR